LLIAEGTYAGTFPSFNFANPSAANVFSSAAGVGTFAASIVTVVRIGEGGLYVDDFTHVAALNEVVSTTITGRGTSDLTWSELKNPAYTPMFGAPASAPGQNLSPAWNPATQQFSWDTSGSSRGRYTWEVTAMDQFGPENGLITIDVPFVPEPSSLVLFCVSAIATLGQVRLTRRNSDTI
jgi:hypothetical protein